MNHEELLVRVNYGPLTGKFVRIDAGKNRPDLLGPIPGRLTADGYIDFTVMRRHYLAHRLAWFYMKGEWPAGLLDHRNGVRHDNRWDNLRDADSTGNAENRRNAHAGNTSGLLGVSWRSRSCKWVAQIQVQKRKITIGEFDDKHLAHAAYLVAKRAYHPHCTI